MSLNQSLLTVFLNSYGDITPTKDMTQILINQRKDPPTVVGVSGSALSFQQGCGFNPPCVWSHNRLGALYPLVGISGGKSGIVRVYVVDLNCIVDQTTYHRKSDGLHQKKKKKERPLAYSLSIGKGPTMNTSDLVNNVPRKHINKYHVIPLTIIKIIVYLLLKQIIIKIHLSIKIHNTFPIK
ncbi:hypothetical protein ACOSQ4_022261 [Xanthoceras sorbifolium]